MPLRWSRIVSARRRTRTSWKPRCCAAASSRCAGQKVEQFKPPPEAQWVLNGDRGLTYSDTLPEGSTLVEGEWWPVGYSGEPLVSFERDLARHLGLAHRRHGDGQRPRPQRHGTHRQPARGEVGKPGAELRHGLLGEHAAKRAAQPAGHCQPAGRHVPLATEARIGRAIGKAFPSVTVIRVRDALEAATAILSKVMVAVRAAGTRHPAGRGAGAGRRPRHRAAAPHPRCRGAQGAGRDPPGAS